ncbi:hypothetical protein FCM35_KLT14523 [Carex littledalei]|uniref:Uncharacterized protein n=1 Tax=Carex littledalei TaxID=544730 RepID=A0A833VDB2_9POAL|nr:hypothetical protein FCM35_KLT14523 [Carex littledalei]
MAGTDNVQRRKSKRLNPSIDPAPPPTQAATPAPQPPPTQAMTHPPQPPTQAETPSPKPPATLAATFPSDPSLRKPNGKPNINRRTSTRSLTGGSDLSGPIATAVQSLPKPGARVTIPAPAFTPLSDVLPPDLTDNIISMDEVDTVQRRKSARLNPSTEPGPSPPEWTPKLLTRPPLPPRKGVIADPSPPPTQAATPAPQPPTQAATPAPQPPLTQEETPAPPPPIQAATPSPQPPPIQAATPSPQPQPIQAATPAPPPPIQAATPSPQPQPTQAATPPPLPLTQEATPAPPPPIQAATPSPQPQPTQAATPPPQPPPTQAATAARAPGKLKQKGKSPPERRISSRECDPAVRRRSKRLNPGDEDVPPLTGTAPEKVASTPQPPPEPQETTPLSAPLSSQTRSESVSSAKIFFGPNPTNPRLKPKKRVEEGQNSHMADEGLSESPHTPEGFVSSPSPQRSNLGEAGAAASPPSEQVSDWSDWEQDITSESQPAFKSAATQSAPQGTVPENSHGPELSEQSMGQQAAVEDDGGRRFPEKGPSVGLVDVFDRLHTRNTDEGKVYVNDRAKDVGERYQQVKKILGHEYSDEALWVLAADGEDRRGRVFGFGNKARTSKANRELQAMEASGTDPTKSTATSAEDAKKTFTDSEVARLVNEKILAERRAFAQEIAAQEERHRAEMADVKKQNKWSNICIDALFKATGTRPPPIDEELRGQDGGGDASDLG